MIFLAISWIMLLIAALIGIRHLKRYHTAKKKALASCDAYADLTEREKVLLYDVETERERSRHQEMKAESHL